MKYKLISFDLQGTLSDSAFSDEFWLEFLPKLHAKKYNMKLAEAKEERESKFQEVGRYDPSYYCHRTALKELWPEWTFQGVVEQLRNKPKFFEDSLPLLHRIREQNVPLIIFSATTHDFIKIEMGNRVKVFTHIFSAFDDFDTAGKRPETYEEILKQFRISPDQMLHIGDCMEMDIMNAKKASVDTFFWDKMESRTNLLSDLTELVLLD